jgi:hypothetical protein
MAEAGVDLPLPGPFLLSLLVVCDDDAAGPPRPASGSCGPLDFFVPTPTFAELESGQ